jgi:hypothetical protein
LKRHLGKNKRDEYYTKMRRVLHEDEKRKA